MNTYISFLYCNKSPVPFSQQRLCNPACGCPPPETNLRSETNFDYSPRGIAANVCLRDRMIACCSRDPTNFEQGADTIAKTLTPVQRDAINTTRSKYPLPDIRCLTPCPDFRQKKLYVGPH